MATVQWQQLVGQERIKEVLCSAVKNNSLGHAYLFCGESGTGTFAAALELSMALLCEAPQRPCYSCDSCKKVQSYSHPDFHVIMPVDIKKEHSTNNSLNENGWKHLWNCVASRISDPYTPREFSSAPSIPVEWMREVTHAIGRGATGKGLNVAIMDGADMLRKESANTMLKTLEEPPAGTLIILIAEKSYAVLPTILSRCQLLRFSAHSPEIIRSELIERLSLDPADPALESLVHTGSLGESLVLAQNPPHEIMEKASRFWSNCLARNWAAVIDDIDTLMESADNTYLEKFIINLLQLIRFAFLDKFSGTVNYFKKDMPYRIELPPDLTPRVADQYIRYCEDTLSALKVRGNGCLVLVNLAFSLMEIIDGKEQ